MAIRGGSMCTQNPDIAWKGGALPFPRIFLEDLSTMHWGPSKVIIHHRKVIISPQKCALIPQNLTTFL